MCGRYYVDDETAREIQRLVKELDSRLPGEENAEKPAYEKQVTPRPKEAGKKDIHPSEEAAIVRKDKAVCLLDRMLWGFPDFNKKGVIFNARSETVFEKKMFSDSAKNRRCVIPARGFYEWDHEKNKISFERPDRKILYLAGIFSLYEGRNRFVILTTRANASVREAHERMPLILEENEIESWLFKGPDQALDLLHKEPGGLIIKEGYVQQRLWQ